MQIGELLTPEQIQKVVDILNSSQDTTVLARQLKDYLRPLTKELEAKGVLPDYLAYVLVASRAQILATQARNN